MRPIPINALGSRVILKSKRMLYTSGKGNSWLSKRVNIYFWVLKSAVTADLNITILPTRTQPGFVESVLNIKTDLPQIYRLESIFAVDWSKTNTRITRKALKLSAQCGIKEICNDLNYLGGDLPSQTLTNIKLLSLQYTLINNI